MFAAVISDTIRGLIGDQAIYFALAAIGLNIHFGYTGLLNFGQAVFMAAGAYGLSMTVITFGGSFWLGVFMGIFVFPVILALILGIPTLRLRADYLAMVTIATAEIFRLIARTPSLDKWTGSSDGLSGFAKDFYALSPFQPRQRYFFNLFQGNQMWVFVVGWITVALAVGLTYLLINSPWGRVLKAIREDEDAARSLGKSAFTYKMQALILGGVIGAVGGMIRAIGTQSAQPDNFITDVTFFAWVAVILGGAGTIFGPVLGSMILWCVLAFADTVLRQGVSSGTIPDWLLTGTQVGQVRFMLVGGLLVFLAWQRPQGLFGNKEEMALDDR
ncbi:MAG: branched-chain amino acid ABC transporter permease [Acidimicrobiia bacterium]